MDPLFTNIEFLSYLQASLNNIFEYFIVPSNVVHLFQKHNPKVFTRKDVYEIKAKEDSRGAVVASSLLLERLMIYEDWYPCLMKVLVDQDAKLGHVVKCIEEAVIESEKKLKCTDAKDSNQSCNHQINLERQNNQLQNTVKDLQTTECQLRKENVDLKSEIEVLKEIIERLYKRIKTLEDDCKNSDGQVKQLRINASKKIPDQNYLNLAVENHDLKRKNEALENEKLELQDLIQRLQDEKAKMYNSKAKFVEDNKQLHIKIEKINEMFASHVEQMQKDFKSLNEKYLELQRINAELKKENQELHVELKEKDLLGNESEMINYLRQKILELKAENKALLTSVEKLQHEIEQKNNMYDPPEGMHGHDYNVTSTFQDQINLLKERIRQMEKEKDSLEEIVNQRTNELTAMINEKKALQKQNESLSNKLEEINALSSTSKCRINVQLMLQEEINQLKEKLASKNERKESEEDKKKASSRDKQLDHMFHKTRSLETELKNQKDIIAALEKTNLNLKTENEIQLLELKRTNNVIERFNDLQQRYMELAKMVEQLTIEKNNFECEVSVQCEEIKKLQQALKNNSINEEFKTAPNPTRNPSGINTNPPNDPLNKTQVVPIVPIEPILPIKPAVIEPTIQAEIIEDINGLIMLGVNDTLIEELTTSIVGTDGLNDFSKGDRVVSNVTELDGKKTFLVNYLFHTLVARRSFNLYYFYKNLLQCLKIVNYNVSAIFFAIEVGEAVSPEHKVMIDVLKGTLGADIFSKNVVCIVTKLPSSRSLPDSTEYGFSKWCKNVEGDLESIFKDCNYRCVYFNYSSENQNEIAEQVQKLKSMATKLPKYTKTNFDEAAGERDPFVKTFT